MAAWDKNLCYIIVCIELILICEGDKGPKDKFLLMVRKNLQCNKSCHKPLGDSDKFTTLFKRFFIFKYLNNWKTGNLKSLIKIWVNKQVLDFTIVFVSHIISRCIN